MVDNTVDEEVYEAMDEPKDISEEPTMEFKQSNMSQVKEEDNVQKEPV